MVHFLRNQLRTLFLILFLCFLRSAAAVKWFKWRAMTVAMPPPPPHNNMLPPSVAASGAQR
jgi:hypothetical protein